VITGWTAAGNHFETFFVHALAYGGTDTTHATGHIRYFLTHFYSSLVDLISWGQSTFAA
jgi:hypothetical protein